MAYQVPRINLCCNYCSLRTGVFIVGFINLVFFSYPFVWYVERKIKRLLFQRYQPADIGFLQTDFGDIHLFTEIMFTLVLLFATYKINPCYMMPFILLQTCTAGLIFLIFIFHLFLHYHTSRFLVDVIMLFAIFFPTYYSVIVVSSFYRNLKEGRMIS